MGRWTTKEWRFDPQKGDLTTGFGLQKLVLSPKGHTIPLDM